MLPPSWEEGPGGIVGEGVEDRHMEGAGGGGELLASLSSNLATG